MPFVKKVTGFCFNFVFDAGLLNAYTLRHLLKMKRIVYLPALSISLLAASSCDPARQLVLKTGREKGSYVKLYGRNSLLPFTQQATEARVLFQVPSGDTIKKTLYYGIGGWPDASVSHLAEAIDSIVLYDGARLRSLRGREEIELYLKQHRSGYGKSVLTIDSRAQAPAKD